MEISLLMFPIRALAPIYLDKLASIFPLSFLATVATDSKTGDINLLEAIGLGIIQGLTEFLPISSSGHLKVLPMIFGWGDPGVAFIAVIQLGSIAAVLWYFWQDLRDITIGAYKAIVNKDYTSQEFKLALGIGLGTIPIIILGLLIKKIIPDYDNSPLRSLGSIAIFSIVMSILLGLAEKLGKRQKTFAELTTKDGILMGIAQALAIIPGVSRSGSTLTAGLFMGLERAAAARFSFLLGIPAITLAGLVELKEVKFSEIGLLPVIVGIISAALVSYASIAWLIKFLKTQNTWIFVWYRLAFGVAILTAISGGAIPNK